MRTAFSELDAILRGDATKPSSLRRGEVPVSAKRMLGVVVLLGLLWFKNAINHPKQVRALIPPVGR